MMALIDGMLLSSAGRQQFTMSLTDLGELVRQVRVLNRELLVESGRIDLYAQDTQGQFVVVELKRGRATQDAVPQLGRYVALVQPVVGMGAVRRILAAPSITGPARRELEGRGLEVVEVSALPVLEKTTTQPNLF